MNDIMPESRVLVFDYWLYKDDKNAPFSVDMMMKPATVICRYGQHSKVLGIKYPDLIDVKFDHREDISKGHFTKNAEYLG